MRRIKSPWESVRELFTGSHAYCSWADFVMFCYTIQERRVLSAQKLIRRRGGGALTNSCTRTGTGGCTSTLHSPRGSARMRHEVFAKSAPDARLTRIIKSWSTNYKIRQFSFVCKRIIKSDTRYLENKDFVV